MFRELFLNVSKENELFLIYTENCLKYYTCMNTYIWQDRAESNQTRLPNWPTIFETFASGFHYRNRPFTEACIGFGQKRSVTV